jgi:dipeptidyl aminopeptidase/acylaminoacyl peptidase
MLENQDIITGIIIAAAFVLLPAGFAQAADLQYGSVGLIGESEFGVQYNSPDGQTNFVCEISSKDCQKQESQFSPRPAVDGIEGTVYWSPQNTYAVAERPLNVFGKYLYRIYRNTGDDMIPVGYVPYYEQTTQLRFSQDESTLFLAAADGTTAKVPAETPHEAVTTTINKDALGRWVLSPDGSLLAGYKENSDDRYQYSLVVQDLATGKQVAAMPSDARHDIAISADNQHIAYIDRAEGDRVVTVRSLNNPDSATKQITDLGWLDHLVTSGGQFYFVANTPDSPYDYKLYQYDPGSTLKSITDDIAASQKLQAGPENVFFAIKDGAARHVGRYQSVDRETTEYDLMATDKQVSQPAVRRKVVKIDDQLTGALLTPHPQKPRNVLVWLHGGPHRQTDPGYNSSLIYGVYDELLNAYARSGWAVLKLDYTGSTGYSAAFREDIFNNIGSADVADTKQAIDWLNDTFAQPEINLMGVSYGGYLGLKTAVEHPDQINRVVSVNGVTDWMTDTLIDPTFRPYFSGRPSPDTINAYMESSLIYDLEDLQDTPVLAIQSTEDNIVDPVQAALLDRVAQKEDVPVTYRTIEGAPHILEKRSHLDTLCNMTAEFLPASGVCGKR